MVPEEVRAICKAGTFPDELDMDDDGPYERVWKFLETVKATAKDQEKYEAIYQRSDY